MVAAPESITDKPVGGDVAHAAAAGSGSTGPAAYSICDEAGMDRGGGIDLLLGEDVLDFIEGGFEVDDAITMAMCMHGMVASNPRGAPKAKAVPQPKWVGHTCTSEGPEDEGAGGSEDLGGSDSDGVSESECEIACDHNGDEDSACLAVACGGDGGAALSSAKP